MLIYLVYLTYCKICDRLSGYKDTDLAYLSQIIKLTEYFTKMWSNALNSPYTKPCIIFNIVARFVF